MRIALRVAALALAASLHRVSSSEHPQDDGCALHNTSVPILGAPARLTRVLSLGEGPLCAGGTYQSNVYWQAAAHLAAGHAPLAGGHN